jgi:hypothetical protein
MLFCITCRQAAAMRRLLLQIWYWNCCWCPLLVLLMFQEEACIRAGSRCSVACSTSLCSLSRTPAVGAAAAPAYSCRRCRVPKLLLLVVLMLSKDRHVDAR